MLLAILSFLFRSRFLATFFSRPFFLLKAGFVTESA